jgi:hypothetical protein
LKKIEVADGKYVPALAVREGAPPTVRTTTINSAIAAEKI